MLLLVEIIPFYLAQKEFFNILFTIWSGYPAIYELKGVTSLASRVILCDMHQEYTKNL